MWKYLAMKCWTWWIHTELCDYCSYNTANFLDQHVANWYISWESKSFSSKNFTYLMFLLLGHTYHQKILLKLLITINRVMVLHLVQKACDVLLFLLRITNVVITLQVHTMQMCNAGNIHHRNSNEQYK